MNSPALATVRLPRLVLPLVCLSVFAASWLATGTANAADDSETALGRLAAGMRPGSWAELKTEGFTAELLKVQNHHILEYSDTAVWHPGTRQVLFVGQGHYSAVKFIAYSASTNAWKLMPTPSWWKGDPETGKGPIGHAYNNNALDARRGRLFHHQSNTRLVHQYDIAAGEWTTLPEIKDAATGHGTALVYFPDRDGLVRVYGGTLHLFDERQPPNAWSVWKDKVAMGPYHNLAKYDARGRAVICGAGNGSRTLQRLEPDGRLVPLPEAPFAIRISSTVVSVDPVCGDLLVLNMEDKNKFWTLGTKPSTWRQLPDAPLTDGVAVPIDTFGVTMYLSPRPASVFVYKHALADNGP